ncbi:MAG: hypothetical protein ABIP58_02670, partial [Dehalococcoidia bacterium]
KICGPKLTAEAPTEEEVRCLENGTGAAMKSSNNSLRPTKQTQALQLAAVEAAGRDERIAELETEVGILRLSLFTLHSSGMRLTAYLTKHENYETVSRC